MLDEREESLREMAAIGNFKAVYLYIRNGVNVNSVNKINGWSPLHWAAHRGHATIVKLLLTNEADPTLKNNKGQTAADLATTNTVREAFGLEVKEQPETETTSNEPSFVPNYITSPDLGKLWSIPDDVVEPRVKLPFEKLEQAFSTKEDKPQPSNEASIVPPSQPVSTEPSNAHPTIALFPLDPTSNSIRLANSEVKELLISLESQNSHTVLGAIFIPPSASVSKAVEMIREEIDNVPTNFKVARYNKDRQQTVPISTKQMEHPISRHFRAEGEQLVLIPL